MVYIYFYVVAKLLLILLGRYTSDILMSAAVCEIRLLNLVLPTVFLCHWDVMASQNILCSGN